MPSAYLLVSHGSRDPRPQFAMERLAALLSQSQARVEATGYVQTVGDSSPRQLDRYFPGFSANTLAATPVGARVGTAYLELTIPLHEQIKEFGDRVLASGCNCLQIVPLFLLSGVHVMEDIPTEVEIARQALEQLRINLRPHLGTHPGMSRLLAQLTTKKDAWILLAHGSSRAGSKQSIEAMAKQLNAVSAYWAVPPRLELRVKELVSAGHRQIGILPYFLFAGGITDAIAQSVEELKSQFPDALLQLAEPLGASAELADLIWDLVEE